MLNQYDGDLCDMTGVMVSLRNSRRHRSGQPQLYVWLPGRRACSVYGSIARYAARRDDYWRFLVTHTRNEDEATVLLTTLDGIVSGDYPICESVALVPVEVRVPAEPRLVRYEVHIGKWSAGCSRDVS